MADEPSAEIRAEVLERLADDLEKLVGGRLEDIDRYEKEGKVRYGAPAEMEALNDAFYEHFERAGVFEAIDNALDKERKATRREWHAACRVNNAYVRMMDTPLRARRIARELKDLVPLRELTEEWAARIPPSVGRTEGLSPRELNPSLAADLS